MNRIDRLLTDVQAHLGLSRLLGRRALVELRDHLEDSVAEQLSQGVDKGLAEQTAVQRVGSPDELVRSVIDSSRGIRMVQLFKKHLLATAAALAAPGVLLLGISFLTFNFPCRDVTYEYMGDVNTYRQCGVPALQSIRPLVSEVGFFGGPAWAQWTIHTLAIIGPLFASLLLIQSRLSLRRRQTPEGTAEIAFALDRKHMLALAATLSTFVVVVAYKLAGP